jgi:deazaflavin-dependent oxidoreductase (nitroreductase family)
MAIQGEYVPSTRPSTAKQVAEYERSEGREGNTMLGKPVVVVTMLGARSGKVRKVPVMRVEHAGRYAMVASQGGAPHHPGWHHNLLTNPDVELQDGPEPRPFRAHVAEGAEREEWWARAVEAFPNYASYQEKTDRVIPVFVLEPVS